MLFNFCCGCDFIWFKLFSVYYLKIVHCFLIKHLIKSFFLNLNAKSECFFMFKFQNERIFLFCIDKIFFYTNKICSLYIMFTIYSNLFTVFIKSVFFVLSKIVHCFLIKIVHCFLHKLFPTFCIKLFSVQYYLQNFHSLFWVNYFLFTI